MSQDFEKDAALSKLLQTWKLEAQLPPRFQESVWRRIEQADVAMAPGFVHAVQAWLERALDRPALGAAYIVVLLFAALGAGYWRAADETSQAQAQWRAPYVQTVDPYRMPRN